jgi:hypothetical protein
MWLKSFRMVFGIPGFYSEEPGDSPAGSGSGSGTDDDVDPIVAELRKKIEDERRGRLAEMKAAKELKAKLDSLGDIDLEEYRTLKSQQAEAERLKAEERGDYEKLVRTTAEKYREQEETLKSQLSEQQAEADRLFASYELTQAFTKANGQDRLQPYFEMAASKFYRVEMVDNQRQFVFESPDGSPLFTKDGKEVKTASQLAVYMREETDAGVFFEPVSGVKGTGVGNNEPRRTSGNNRLPVIDRNDPIAAGRHYADVAAGRAVWR